MELVYISDLKSEFWGFESPSPHQISTVSVRIRLRVPIVSEALWPPFFVTKIDTKKGLDN